MKLRLPKKLTVALVAAITAACFTLPQAIAQETPLTLTIPADGQIISGNSSLNWTGSTSAGLSSWRLTFELDPGTDLPKDIFNLHADTLIAGTGYHLTIGTSTSLTLRDHSNTELATVDISGRTPITLAFVKDVDEDGVSLGTGTFYLSSNGGTVQEAAVTQIGTSGIYNTTFHPGTGPDNGDTRFWTNTGRQKIYNITLTQLDDNKIVVSTWQGTEQKHDWADSVWDTGTYKEGNWALFGAEGHNEVTISAATTASFVSVNEREYTFEIERDGSLTAANAYIADGASLTIAGEGTATITTLSGAGNLTVGGTLVAGGEAAFDQGCIHIDGGELDLGGYAMTNLRIITEGVGAVIRNGTLIAPEFVVTGSGVDTDELHIETNKLNLADAGEISFRNAVSSRTGGAINGDASSIITLSNNETVTFSGNSTSWAGGAIYGSSFSVITFNGNRRVMFSENSAETGGAIFGNTTCAITFNGNESVAFSGNSASGATDSRGGGAIYASLTLDLTDNDAVTFSGNTAKEGGAIDSVDNCSTTFNDNGSVTFSGNSATSSGGAIYDYSKCSTTFNGNGSVTFSQNSAKNGGAICGESYRSSSANITFNGNDTVTFSGNSASADGGAIYGGTTQFGSSATTCVVTLSGNKAVTFSGNSASADGGAIYTNSTTLDLTGNGITTFSGNSARIGGAIYAYFNSVISFNGNDIVTFSGNSGGAITCGSSSDTLNIAGNAHVVFQGNYVMSGSGDSATYHLRSVYGHGSTLNLSAGANQDIVFYDTLYADSDSTVSFNAKYVDKDGVEQEATGDIVFSGTHAEEDLRKLKPNYTQQELTNSLTTEVLTTTNLYGGRLRIEDGAIYQGHGINVAEGSHATLRLANSELNQADYTGRYDVTLASGTKLDLQGVNKISAGTLDMQEGSILSFTLGETNLTMAALTLDGIFNQGGNLTISIQGDETHDPANTYRLISMTSRVTPTTWDIDKITLSGADTNVNHLRWANGVLYYGEFPLVTASWSGEQSRMWNFSDKNWTQDGNHYRYQDGVDVIFGDTGSGEVVLADEVSPLSVLVENSSSEDYAFIGDGKLTGEMKLTKEGEGTLTISTANDYSGGTVLNGGILEVNNATALGSGDVHMQGGRLHIVQDLTLEGQITVAGEKISSIVVADGATLYLTHTITNENYIELAGKVDISAISGTATGSCYYMGGETKGNGFLQTEYEMMLIDCGLSGDLDWSEAEIYHSGNKVAKEGWGSVTYAIADASTFYIFSGTESVSKARSLDANTNVQMSSGTTLKVDEDINLSQIQATGGATISIDSGKELSGYTSSMNLTLEGAGVYALDSCTSLGSLALGNDWMGTVRLSGTVLSANFNSMARAGSWLVLNGFSGFQNTYNGTTTANIILTDKDDGTAAFTASFCDISCYDGFTMKFTGDIKGEGTFVANAASNRYEDYEFAGDISGWTGEFRYASGCDTKLTISGNAHEVNAAIDGTGGLTLSVNTSAAFNKAVAVDGFALNNGIASFNDALQVSGSITASGTSALVMGEGQTLSLGAAIANSGNLTLSGTFDVSGRESVLIGSEYSGGEISGNGFGLTLYGVQVVQNSGSATLDWNAAEIVYDTPGYEKRDNGSIVKGYNDGLFHIMTGTESVSTAQNAAEEAGITMQGVELNNGTTLIVDKEFSAAQVSLISGSAALNVETGVTLLSDGADHTGLSLSGNGMYKLAAGSSSPDIDWSGNDWHGTIMLTDAAKQDWNLNDFGHAGSKVGLDGVSGNFARPNVCGEIVSTLVLVGDGLTVTACYTNAKYTFSGGVEGDGHWTYGLTGNPHNQTYIFTGDVSNWTGAYESIVDGKTSTLQFQEDAVEMGAAIKQTAGIINVVVGNGTDEHTTTFTNTVEASSLTVQKHATAILGGDTTITDSLTLHGLLKTDGGSLTLKDGVSLTLGEGAEMQFGAAMSMRAKQGGAMGVSDNTVIEATSMHGKNGMGTLNNVDVDIIEDYTIENMSISGSVIDISEGKHLYVKHVNIAADARITDEAAWLDMVDTHGWLDNTNTVAEEPVMSLGDTLFYRSGDDAWMRLDHDVSYVALTSELFSNVIMTGSDLWLDLTGLADTIGSARAFSIAFKDALYDVNGLRVVATVDGEHYLDGYYTTKQEGTTTTLYFSSQIPEPTTSTLSLLALAALAARRRKKDGRA